MKNINIWGEKFPFDHFISEGEKRSTIYDIINRFEFGKNEKHQSWRWSASKNFKQTRQKKLKRLVNYKDGVSQRKLTCCFKCTQSLVHRVIKSMGIQKYKRFQTEAINKS